MRKWYRLDNAAKIFPSVSNKKRTNVFRLSFLLKEPIDKEILKEAVSTTLHRFPSLKVRMKRGLFWYYLEENDAQVYVYEETPFMTSRLKRKANNGYMFKVFYFDHRISLEMFHSLTDGSGAMEFLKAIVYNYLVLKGYSIDSEDMILTDLESFDEEAQDSFLKNYDNRLPKNPREKKAVQIEGTPYQDNWRSLIIGKLDIGELKEVAHRYSATISEFICGCLIESALQIPTFFERKHRPFQIFIPVNLRKYFISHTLRNFSLYLATGVYLDQKLSFEEIMEIVKKDFERELKKEKLQSKIAANVMLEKNIIMRLVPLILKELVLKIGYNAWGDSPNTLTFSNLGKTDLPKQMEPLVEDIIFANGASNTSPVNIAAVGYQNRFNISFSSSIAERDIQREFFRIVSGFGINVILESNEPEVAK
jgi:NRPS condensation-like uncharacterized protein